VQSFGQYQYGYRYIVFGEMLLLSNLPKFHLLNLLILGKSLLEVRSHLSFGYVGCTTVYSGKLAIPSGQSFDKVCGTCVVDDDYIRNLDEGIKNEYILHGRHRASSDVAQHDDFCLGVSFEDRGHISYGVWFDNVPPALSWK
jgi:hypothetical protein